ncbi:MAG: hypothetical protein EZS28_051579, partial [Streblomastix strix]
VIAHDILEFLVQFHLKGLVHCNIKPQQILFHQVEDYIIPKVCGFGETVSIQLLKDATEISGSPFYFPPEVRNKKGGYDFGIDIWELGLCLYILASGKKHDHPSYALLRNFGLVLPPELAE